jgi:hypothetical protein
MKKTALTLLMICALSVNAFATKDGTNEETVPDSFYKIISTNTESSWNAMLVPLYIQSIGNGFESFGFGLETDFSPHERFGFSVRGLKSYYYFPTKSKYMNEQSSASSYQVEGGIYFNFIVDRTLTQMPIQLGARSTGYNQTTVYYAMCDIPVKKLWAARAGYLRDSAAYKLSDEDSYPSTTTQPRSTVDSLYAGIEWSVLYDIEIEANDPDLIRNFGSRFAQKQHFKLYADGILPVHNSGEQKKEKNWGFRAGLVTYGKFMSWGIRLEGGISPSYGANYLLEMGLCL